MHEQTAARAPAHFCCVPGSGWPPWPWCRPRTRLGFSPSLPSHRRLVSKSCLLFLPHTASVCPHVCPPPPPSCHLCVSLGLCLDPFRPPEKPRLHLLSPWQGRRCCCWHQSARDSPPMSLPVPRAFRPIRELRAPCFLSERTLCLALPCSLRSSFSSSNPLGSLPL